MTTDLTRYIDLVEAAKELTIHPQSLRRLVKAGQVPSYRVGIKYLFDRDAIATFKQTYNPKPGRRKIR